MRNDKHFIIIGAGFSGTLVAIHLLRLAPARSRVSLVDRTGQFGRGIAYSTPDPNHLLNVPAARMSAFANEPQHFFEWAQKQIAGVQPTSFLSRQLYGKYLEAVLSDAEKTALGRVAFERIADEAVDAVTSTSGSIAVRLKSGREIVGASVVLAVGNLPPAQSNAYFLSVQAAEDRYVGNIWTSELWPKLSLTSDIIILGTGLTMVDAVISLKDRGHTGKIWAISRRGHLPMVHKSSAPYPPFATLAEFSSARATVRLVRREIKRAATLEIDWRAVIDALRPLTSMIWQSFSLKEKRRFLRHARPYWEIARHRMAPEIYAQIQELIKSGQLKIVAMRSLNVQIKADFVVNCTGPESDYRKHDQPLLQSLMKQGAINPDPIGMGFQTNSERFFTIGPPRKGELWETTAVPELRVQAEELANQILNRIG